MILEQKNSAKNYTSCSKVPYRFKTRARLRSMIQLLSAFFAFGAIMCTLTIVLLLFPGTSLDSLWR